MARLRIAPVEFKVCRCGTEYEADPCPECRNPFDPTMMRKIAKDCLIVLDVGPEPYVREARLRCKDGGVHFEKYTGETPPGNPGEKWDNLYGIDDLGSYQEWLEQRLEFREKKRELKGKEQALREEKQELKKKEQELKKKKQELRRRQPFSNDRLRLQNESAALKADVDELTRDVEARSRELEAVSRLTDELRDRCGEMSKRVFGKRCPLCGGEPSDEASHVWIRTFAERADAAVLETVIIPESSDDHDDDGTRREEGRR